MMKDLKSMLKDAMILLAITIVAGLVLGVVYQVTKEPIAQQEAKAKQKACQEVFSDAASFEAPEGFSEEAAYQVISEQYPNQDINEVVKAVDASGQTLGYVITITTHEGYGGDIRFSVGIRNDGTVNGISILSIAETPGLGMNAESVLVPQFENVPATMFTYTKSGSTSESEIDAISGATITTDAINNGVNAAVSYFNVMYASQVVTEGGETNEE